MRMISALQLVDGGGRCALRPWRCAADDTECLVKLSTDDNGRARARYRLKPLHSRTLMMNRARALVIATFAVLPSIAHAQSYPAKPIRIVVPYTAGGSVDVL